MSSRANPKVVEDQVDSALQQAGGVWISDSYTALRDDTCDVILTDAGLGPVASAVWVAEVALCDS